MTIENIILGFILLMFGAFIVSLGGVAWWTGRKSKLSYPEAAQVDTTPWYGQDGDNELAA